MPRKPSAPPAVPPKRRHVRRTHDPVLAEVGKLLRQARKKAGYSQESFAAEAGVDRSYWGAVERGLINVGVLALIQVAEALNCEPGELLPSRDAVRALHKPRRG
jgi:transcriptional regulator with XRE-family HTH domain